MLIRLLILTLIGSTASPALAAYPEARESFVNDFAEVLSPQEEQRLRGPLERLREGRGIEAVVVTVPSYRDYGTGDASIESFATGLFNAWGVGHRERDDGALVLLAVEDREVRIEVGEGWSRAYDSRFARIVSERMIPRFKTGDLAGGLQAGVEALEKELVANHPVEDLRTETSPATRPVPAPPTRLPSERSTAPRARQQPRVPPSPVRPRAPAPGRLPELGWNQTTREVFHFGFLASLVVMGFLLQTLIHRLRFRCPECRGQMAPLTEEVEDQFLDAGQETEERIGSVGYDVLRCPSCQAMKVVARNRWLSPARRCQECGYRTVTVTSRVLSRPTYDSSGVEELTYLCEHCRWTTRETRILPRLQRPDEDDSPFGSQSGSRGSSWSAGSSRSSSSSSGGGSSGGRSSFGGGRSSGGGASGKW